MKTSSLRSKDKEAEMDNELMRAMAKELASKINAMINIPLISEDNEQMFFELVVLMVLDLVLTRIEKPRK